MSTGLQCENRLASSYLFNDENLSRTPSPISSCSFYVDTSPDKYVKCTYAYISCIASRSDFRSELRFEVSLKSDSHLRSSSTLRRCCDNANWR